MGRWAAFLLAVVLVGSAIGVTATGVDGFALSASEAIEVPPREVTWNGTTFTIDEVVQRETGQSVTVSATAPTGTSYNVYLVDRQQRIVDATSANGSATLTIDLFGLDPGSYVITIYKDEAKAVLPVVVQGHRLEQDVPTTVQEGQDATITIDVTRIDPDANPPHEVVAYLWDGSMVRNVTATETSGGSYEATLPTADLAPGSYTVLSVVRADREAFGRDVVTGMSSKASIKVVTPTPTPTPTETPSPTTTGGSSNGEGGGSTTETASPTTAPTETSASPTTRSPSPTTTTTTAPATTTQNPTTTTQASPSASTAVTTTKGTSTTPIPVVTPASPTDSPTLTTEIPSQDGMLSAFGLMLIGGYALLAWRRRTT